MGDSTSLDDEIQQHYTRRDLGEAILSALAAAGTDLENLKAEDLAPVDQLHIRGREATVELAQQLRLDAAKRVLDVGSGLGGASRYLAQEFGCRVTGLDLTEEYCRIAQMLTDRLGLGSHVVFRHGSALEMPFEGVADRSELQRLAETRFLTAPTAVRSNKRIWTPPLERKRVVS